MLASMPNAAGSVCLIAAGGTVEAAECMGA